MAQPIQPYKEAFPLQLSDIILTGDIARETCQKLIEHGHTGSYPKPRVSGYFTSGPFIVCFDNTTGDCWVEQTKSEELALLWCQRKIEVEDL